jgi:hypothetical protein
MAPWISAGRERSNDNGGGERVRVSRLETDIETLQTPIGMSMSMWLRSEWKNSSVQAGREGR